MPVNANPKFVQAEDRYHKAKTDEERIEALDEMLKEAPKHKSSENLLANLRTRLKKLQEKVIKSKKIGKGSKAGIKKSDMQAVIIGKTNSGKSSLLNQLTNASPEINKYQYTTKEPIIGMMNYATVQIQVIENPAMDSDMYDRGLTNSADTLIIIVTKVEEIKEIQEKITNKNAKQIIAFNKVDFLDQEKKRKLDATLRSKKYNYILISTKTQEGIEDLKGKIFQSFENIRIYTKEPGKSVEEKREKPVILMPGATVRDVAEKILHGFSKQVKETRIWGPSSKFAGQSVGMNHKLRDMDIVEFKTR